MQLYTLLEHMEWTSADGKHVIYHMLTAIPWPARAAQQHTPPTPLSAWWGTQFDAAAFNCRHRRRPANHIIGWAARWIRLFAQERANALK